MPMLALSNLWRLYRRAQRRPEPLFSDRALRALGISYVVHGDLRDIPAAGPAIVVANHPFGALDGLIVSSLLARRRSDARMLANHLLRLLPDLRDQLLLVNPFGGRTATRGNAPPMRMAIRWIRQGGCLCLFPAGVVSHRQQHDDQVRDPAWHASLARLARLTGAPIVPCFIEGQNSPLFQLAGRVHPFMRTLLLPRELLHARGKKVHVHVGRAIEAAQGAVDRDDQADAECLRRRTYALAPAARVGVKQEVDALLDTQSLVRADSLSVFWARASQAPLLMQEIGREREIAFRAVKEGTGRAIDLDDFDRRYLHLCLWDQARDELAGAYRMHPIETWSGGQEHGLYTQTLFRFDRRLTAALAPAIELGRAFVRPAWQRHHAALALLWTGIGRFVARHRRYRHLFGAVSIGPTYSPAARQLMLDYLRRHAFQPALASLVTPRHPPAETASGSCACDASDIATLNTAVSTLDADGKGIPVLLRQYLKLRARVLGFNVDPSFGHVLDALVVVDVTQAPEALLGRYMGREQAREYLAHHRLQGAAELTEDVRCRRSA